MEAGCCVVTGYVVMCSNFKCVVASVIFYNLSVISFKQFTCQVSAIMVIMCYEKSRMIVTASLLLFFFRHRDLEIPFMSIVYLNTLGFSSDSAQAFLRAPKLCLIGFINEGSGNYAFIAGCHIFEEQASFVRGKIHDISCVIRTEGSVKQVRIVDVSTVTYYMKKNLN